MAHLTINFRSKALGMPVMLDVLMPQGRGGYKTLYLLHGAGGDHTSWVLNTRIADYVNNRNIAVVMPSGKNRFYVNNEYGKNFYTYITEELVSQCEQWFDISRKAEDSDTSTHFRQTLQNGIDCFRKRDRHDGR